MRAREARGSRRSGTRSRAYREPAREPPGALSAARVASRETASRASGCQRRDAVAKVWQRERLTTQTRRIKSASSVSPRSPARSANASASATGAKPAATTWSSRRALVCRHMGSGLPAVAARVRKAHELSARPAVARQPSGAQVSSALNDRLSSGSGVMKRSIELSLPSVE